MKYEKHITLKNDKPFLLSLKNAHIYDIDVTPPEEKKWTELACVQVYHDFFLGQNVNFR